MEELFTSRQIRHFDFDVVVYKVLLRICSLTLACTILFPVIEKVLIGEMKVQNFRIFLSSSRTDDSTQHCYSQTL